MLNTLDMDGDGLVRNSKTGNTSGENNCFSGKAIETFEQSHKISIFLEKW